MKEQKKEKKIALVKKVQLPFFYVGNIKRYVAVFVLKEQGVYSVLKRKRFKPLDNIIRFRKNTFVLDMDKPTYSKGASQYYFIDVNEGQINLKESKGKQTVHPEVIDMLISRKIVSQLTANLSDNQMRMNILVLIFGMVMGGLLGYIIAGFF